MIIFDLDTLADDTHRRHFIDPKYNLKYQMGSMNGYKIGTGEPFKPDYDAYKAASGDDVPINATKESLIALMYEGYKRYTQIWSTRCESTRDITVKWLNDEVFANSESSEYIHRMLKMRPIGNTEPAHVLKEGWLNERCADMIEHVIKGEEHATKHDIDFVFDADPESISMFRRRGVYVFDCRQV